VSQPLLEIEGVRAGYVPGMPIVHDVSVHARAGEIVTIIGPNGAGKSTLLKAIVGLLALESGRIRLEERDLAGLASDRIVASGIGYVPQLANVFVSLTVEENLRVGGHLLGRAAMSRRLAAAYERHPILFERRRSPAGALSGGERQMLAIARALMTEPRILILDEPTASLAPKAVGEAFGRLRALAESGVAVLMVEQNARAALRISDRGYVLTEGRNRLSGPAAELLADPALGQAFLGGTHRQ
jgi:branched-chain amino acid transport system ATP-binding protein